MATAGYKLPKVNFLSISLAGGNDLLRKNDEPHTRQASEMADALFGTGATTSSLEEDYTTPSIMNVNIVLSIDISFDVSKSNLYSMFFKDDFTKYLKIRVVQSTGTFTEAIANNVNSYLRPGGVIDSESPVVVGGVGSSPSVVVQNLDLPEYDGKSPELTQDLAFSTSMRYDSEGNKVYTFTYPVTFQVPESEGGTDVEQLSYFVHSYINIEQYKIESGYFEDFQIPEAIVDNLVMGEVNQVQVIRNGSINNYSQVFYKSPLDDNGLPRLPEPDDDLEIWTGPIHYHGPQNPGPKGYIGYMAGSPGADMGPFLGYTTVFNGTIKDFRTLKQLEKLQFNYSLFSNTWFNEKTTRNMYNNQQALKQYMSRENPYFSDTYGYDQLKDLQLANLKLMSETKGRAPIFSDLYTAMDGSGNTRFLFAFNVKEALKSNSAFPALLDHIFEGYGSAEGLVEDFINNKVITSFKILRHRVHEENPAMATVDKKERIENEEPKLVCESSDDNSGKLKNDKQENDAGETLGTIAEIDLHLAEVEQNANIIFGLRHYTGTDLQTPIDGDYMYSIEIKMNDPLIPWMEGKIKILETLLYGAEDNEEDGGFSGYADMVSSDPKYYNSYTDRFTQEGIEKIEHPDSPYKTVNNYSYASSKIVSFFTVLDNFLFFRDKLPDLYHFLYAISSPAFGNPSGVNQVLKVMENIYSKVLNVFSSASGYKKAVDSQHVGADQQLAAGREPKRNFVISHLFPQVIKGEINHSTGYDYISRNNTATEDSLPSKGLKRLSRTEFTTRANMEETKFFTNVFSDYDIEIPEFPLAYDPKSPLGEGAPTKQAEGIILNPADTVLNNKYAFFSPSLVNFAGEEPINLLNGGSLNSDMRDTNNAMLNAIRYNLTKQNDYDYPDPGSEVATGRIKTLPLGLNVLAGSTTPEVVVTDDVSDLKYDLLNILNQRQTTVRIPKAPAGPAGSTKGKSKGVANVFGGPVSSELIEASTIAIDPNAIGSQYDLGPAGGEGPNIFNSKINPSQLLLTITQENAFNFLDDRTWKWKHYVMDFNYNSFKSEYQKFMGSGGNADGTGYSNKPLKVAPNQVKCLMSNLDYTKPFSVGVFDELILKIYDTKPGVFANLTGQGVGDTQQLYVSTNMYGEEKVISEPNRKVIYETPEFLSFFLMNFKNLVELQALVAYEDTYETSISPIAGFDVDKELGYNVNAPIWKTLNYEMYEKLLKDVQTIPGGGQRNILVRLVPYEKDLYGVKRYPIMELPIYNMHFIIDLSEYNVGAVYFPDPVVIDELDPDEAGATEYEGFIPVGVGTTLFGESVTTGMMPEIILETQEGWVGGFAGGPDVGTGAGVVEGEPGTSPVVQAGQGGLVGIAGAGAGQEGPKLGPLGDPDADGGGVPLMQKGIFSFLKTSSQNAGRLGVSSETISAAAAPAASVEQQGMKEADQAAMKATTEQSQY